MSRKLPPPEASLHHVVALANFPPGDLTDLIDTSILRLPNTSTEIFDRQEWQLGNGTQTLIVNMRRTSLNLAQQEPSPEDAALFAQIQNAIRSQPELRTIALVDGEDNFARPNLTLGLRALGFTHILSVPCSPQDIAASLAHEPPHVPHPHVIVLDSDWESSQSMTQILTVTDHAAVNISPQYQQDTLIQKLRQEKLSPHPPDALLVNEGGLGLIRSIAQVDPTLPIPPIILLSGNHRLPPDAIADVRYYLKRPADINKVITAIQRAAAISRQLPY